VRTLPRRSHRRGAAPRSTSTDDDESIPAHFHFRETARARLLQASLQSCPSLAHQIDRSRNHTTFQRAEFAGAIDGTLPRLLTQLELNPVRAPLPELLGKAARGLSGRVRNHRSQRNIPSPRLPYPASRQKQKISDGLHSAPKGPNAAPTRPRDCAPHR